jgi:hypothetical protein
MEQDIKQVLQRRTHAAGAGDARGDGRPDQQGASGYAQGAARDQATGAQTPVEIHFYHCDHLDTPIALTGRRGQIV